MKIFDLDKVKVGDLNDKEIEELKDYLMSSANQAFTPSKAAARVEIVKFLAKVLDKEYTIGDKSEKNIKVQKFLSSNIFEPFRKEISFVKEEKPVVKKKEQKINTNKMSIKDLFLKLTETTMPGGHESLAEPFLPKGWKKDSVGNYYIRVGENPTTMFTSHLDTAITGQPQDVKHVIEGDKIKTDGKTILGADDKSGVAMMIYMIEKGKTGLYYFFHGEEHGGIGSNALDKYLDSHRDDEIYKNVNKVISLDRRDDDSVITFQSGDRCCSDEFGQELAKRLNEAGGFKYKTDPTGAITDSAHIMTKFAECTNLSVGYDRQHTTSEVQDIAFLQKLADAAIKMDWETLPIKRDPAKVEHSYSYSTRGGRRGAYASEYDTERWWDGQYDSPRATTVGPSEVGNKEFVTDYLGNKIRTADAQWCEYDKQWCLKDERIWVEYVGFYTCPDFDPTKVKKETPAGGGKMSPVTIEEAKTDLELFSKTGEPFGKVLSVDDKGKVTIATTMGSKFILSPDKFLTYEFMKKPTSGSTPLKESDLKEGLTVWHPGFGEGKIIGIRPDRIIVKVDFKSKGEKDLRVDVAGMKF